MKDESSSAKPVKRRKKKAKKRSPSAAPAVVTAKSPPAPSGSGVTNTVIIAALALGVGGAAGWFLRDAKTKEIVAASPDTVSSAAPVGSATEGPSPKCSEWSQKACEELGADSEPCTQVQAAAALLPDSACTQAMAQLPATVAKAKSARGICDQLVAKLCKDVGPETESCKMVTERTPSFPASQCRELMGQYDEVLAELEQQEKLNQPLTKEMVAKLAAGDVPSYGPADAKVTVIEFSDFECPYCSDAATTITALKEKYGDKVRFVFRQFPLSFHKQAQLAAEASLAAHAQGKFWAFHDKVFANQDAMGRDALEKHAQDIGLDMAKFKKALDEHLYADAVKKDMTLAEDVPVQGTPTVIVGTKRIAEPGLEQISAEIDAQLGA